MSSPQQMLRDAVAAYQAGRFSEAEAGYRRVLRERPTDHLAFYGLALLSDQAGEKQQAIDYVVRSLTFEPNIGQTWNWLGTLYVETGRPVEAKAAFSSATGVSPEQGEYWCNLAGCLTREGDLDAAVQVLRRVPTCPQAQNRIYEMLANLLCRQGRRGEAAQMAGDWLTREPSNPIARHLAAALSGEHSPARAPDEYVRTHFDDFADSFDSVLKELDYRGPELVSAALQAAAPRASMPAFAALLDAGCGTGLCGPRVRELCGRLIGVDLSPKMLHYAQQRGCYDELVNAELVAFMRSRPQAFDAVICADTFIYFGALAEPLAAAHAALRLGGALAFTVEALLQSGTTDHQLGVSGRYQHREAYLRRVLLESGFTVKSVAQQSIRKNVGSDVAAYLVVAQRQ